MHNNLDKLEDLDVAMYVVSGDQPEQQKELYNAVVEEFGYSLPFISDPDLELTEFFNMKNGDAPYRGYSMMDTEGNAVFNTINDHWGEEFDQTEQEIRDKYSSLVN